MSNSHLFLKPAFIRTPSQNGVGRYVCQLQRIVFKFCKHHGGSRGMREFIEYDLVNFAKDNPGVVVYLKPRRHRSPVIVGEFLNGERQWISCHDQSKDEINKWVNLLKGQQSNNIGIRFRKLWHTDNPSIQGPWTPYTFREPALNLATFPNTELSKPLNMGKSATEQLIEMFQKRQIESLDDKRAE